MTPLRWVSVCTLVAISLFAQRAEAVLSVSPTTIPIGSVPVGSTGMNTGTISESAADETIVSWDLSACSSEFAITTAAPVTVMKTAPVTVTATFTPTTSGIKSCTVSMVGSGAVVIGSFQISAAGTVPTISLSTGSLAFNNVRLTGATPIQMVTVQNTGGAQLSVTSLVFSGTASADYSLSPAQAPFTLNPSQTKNLFVQFDPSIAGSRLATLEIHSNDPATPQADVMLSGTGTTGVIAVTDIAFGTVDVKPQTTSTQPITITNTGGLPKGNLTVSSAVIMNGGGWFAFASNGCTGTSCTFAPALVIASGSSNVSITCDPPANATGTQMATVVFTSDTDDPTDNTAMISCTAGRAEASADKASLSYGNQFLNVASGAQGVTLSNTGNIPLSYSVSLAGVAPGQFQIISGCASPPCTLAAGATIPVTAAFKPTTLGAKMAILRITANNDPDTATVDVALDGTGVAPHLSLSNGTIDLGSVEVGKSNTLKLTVTNTGGADLTIASGQFTTPQTELSVTGGPSVPVPPAGTTSWDFTCTPTIFGSKTATFQILSNTDATHGLTADIATNVTIKCLGLQGVLTITPNPFNFGGVRQGDVSTKTFVVQNIGNSMVSNITGSLTDPNLGYSITSPVTPQALAPNGTFNAVVQFAPDATHDGGPDTLIFSGAWGSTPTTAAGSASINGDGLVAGYDVTPPMQDFGDTRFDDTSKRLTFTIKNTDIPAVTIQTVNISPGPNTATGEFQIQSITRNGTPVTLGQPFTLPTKDDTAVVTVRLFPNQVTPHMGMISATLNVHSDLGMNPDRQVDIKANLTSAGLTVAPGATLDFGVHDVDIDIAGVTQMITLTNTGAAPLNITSVAGPSLPMTRFSLVGAPVVPATVQPGGTYSVTVKYLPLEHPMNQFDTDSVKFGLAGILGGPMLQTVLCQGRGIDRKIQVDAVPAFPATFRNPGDQAPTMPVTVHNMGEAPLDITAVMVSDDPIWSVTNPDPVTVPGLGSFDFIVKFSPTMAGKAPTGHMNIMNNDNGLPLVVVNLDGNGINRAVEMGPAPIDLGYTGVGTPVRLSVVAPSEILHVASMDGTNTFKIRSITVDNDAFEIVDTDGNAPAGVDLAPSTTKTFDVVFTPPTEGDFTTVATLYLDMDTTPQAMVTITGHAVFLDAHGGGGCSTGRDTGAGTLVLVAGALLVARRRRRSQASSGAVVLVVALVVLVRGPVAVRADSRNFDLSVFHPTPATTHETFMLQSADVGANGDWVAAALFSYASNPLVITAPQGDDAAIRTRSTIDVGGAYSFLGRFEAGLHMPFYFQDGQAVNTLAMPGIQPAKGSARGDLTLHGKMRLLRSPKAILGAGATLTLPTATQGEFAGVETPTGRVLGLATLMPAPRVSLAANLGAVLRGHETLQNVDQGSGITWGVGGSYRVLDALWVDAEMFGDVIPSAKREGGMSGRSTMTTVEWLAGVRYRLERRVNVGVAAGRGLSSGIGAPDLRGLFTLEVAPNAAAIGTVHGEPVHDTGDRDGDGVTNDVDKCPNEPEDRDMFDDADGCPDPDNDQDGLADADDKCPLDAEDRDGFQDDDGCPDKDNDEDGIPDAADKCPMVAEDKDGYQDVDGCPDEDNDGDGLADAKDKCPNDPETINGNQDEDGCPDKGDSLVVLSPDRLELLESIQFKGDKIQRSSSNVLGQIGATLRAHGEILRVRITSHVQPTGDDDRDQALTVKRAQAVRDWLVNFGISSARLEVRGFGGTKPLVSPSQKSAAMINDRLELVILERK
jgi:outer membrane protein OmpA-like peptidoglycan-associated protein